jgi:hypothetical protein
METPPPPRKQAIPTEHTPQSVPLPSNERLGDYEGAATPEEIRDAGYKKGEVTDPYGGEAPKEPVRGTPPNPKDYEPPRPPPIRIPPVFDPSKLNDADRKEFYSLSKPNQTFIIQNRNKKIAIATAAANKQEGEYRSQWTRSQTEYNAHRRQYDSEQAAARSHYNADRREYMLRSAPTEKDIDTDALDTAIGARATFKKTKKPPSVEEAAAGFAAMQPETQRMLRTLGVGVLTANRQMSSNPTEAAATVDRLVELDPVNPGRTPFKVVVDPADRRMVGVRFEDGTGIRLTRETLSQLAAHRAQKEEERIQGLKKKGLETTRALSLDGDRKRLGEIRDERVTQRRLKFRGRMENGRD